VTHSPEVKEQLPAAIEVRRTGARRSTASVVDSM
jgi:DNA repair exonuclease SbcCD ATPase subunit